MAIPWLRVTSALIAGAALPGAIAAQTQGPDPAAADLAAPLRAYFAAADPRGPELQDLLRLARGREDELTALLRHKRFLLPQPEVRRLCRLDERGGLVDDAAHDNPLLVVGPAADGALYPLFVYVPDHPFALPFERELREHGTAKGRFVVCVTDERRDNQWRSTPAELDRHTGFLRELLLRHPIDPDRVHLVGSGRGGHATWDVGLVRSGRWAGLCPCNGGLVHEGGYARTAGVFVENGKDLTIVTVYNTRWDHGIESCRHAVKLLRQWGARCEAVEEPAMRAMGLDEAAERLDGVVREAHRRTITKVWNRMPDGSHYWLEALDRTPREWEPTDRIALRAPVPQDPALLRQRVWEHVREQSARFSGTIEGNTVRIEARGMRRLRVWFDPELLDLAAKVTIVVNGRAKPPVLPRRRLDVLLQRVHRTGDTSQLYWDFADVEVPR